MWAVIALLSLFISESQSHQEIICRRKEDEVWCEFRMPDIASFGKQDFSGCLDDFCVEAHVVVNARVIDAEDNKELVQDMNMQQETKVAAEVVNTASKTEAATETTTTTTTTTNTIEVAGLEYSEPFSQYGNAIALALRSYPGKTQSWEYCYWLNSFAIALRGDPESLSSQLAPRNTVAIERAIAVLELSVDIATELQNSQPSENVKYSLSHAYMTMAETYAFDIDNPRYYKALQYYHQANRLIQEMMIENSFPEWLSRADIELDWADSMVRIAVISIEKVQEELATSEPTTVMDIQFDKLAQESEHMLAEAIGVFRQLVAQADSPANEALRKTRLANALQNLSSILSLTGTDSIDSNSLLEEAFTLYSDSLQHMHTSSQDRMSVLSGIAQCLYSLSDGYFQAADYELAKSRYRSAMNWYKTYNLTPPSVASLSTLDADSTVDHYEQKLQDYTMMYNGQGELQVPDSVYQSGEFMYEADELYEADLHFTLGGLRMARDEIHLAIIHLENAVERYARDPNSERYLADAKLNLAAAYFKQGDYELSIGIYEDALDVYKRIVPEGKNPLMEGFEDLLWNQPQSSKQDSTEVDTSELRMGASRLIDMSAYQASILNKTRVSED